MEADAEGTAQVNLAGVDCKEIFAREELLLGSEMMDAIASKRVILFGVGGVGSWCAESLVRSGICHLTIVDSDVVNVTNINRQLPAMTSTVGRPKVEVLRERLLDINPIADITALQAVYSKETADSFRLSSYDYIIDAIDSLSDKANLILEATSTQATFFASMGAALKMDPTKISVAEFWKVKGCPLAAALRRRFRHQRTFPAKKFKCVYSEELLSNKGNMEAMDAAIDGTQAGSTPKKQVNGTVAHATAIFGFMLAGLLIKDIYERYS